MQVYLLELLILVNSVVHLSLSANTVSPTSNLQINTSECGKTKGCFQKPAGCTYTACDYLVTYKPSGSKVEFEISTKVIASVGAEMYVALGFSATPSMPSTSVISCLNDGSDIKIFQSYNDGYSNSAVQNPDLGLSGAQGVVENGRITCKFIREITIPAENADPKVYDLSKPWYLLMARGGQSGGNIQKHNEAVTSSAKISFSKISENGNPASDSNTAPTPGLTIDTSECARSKGCFREPPLCNFNDCIYIATYKNVGENIEFELSAKAPTGLSEMYVALGFSTDRSMGNDYVLSCVYDGSVIKVVQSYNPGYFNEPIDTPMKGLLAGFTGIMENGRITCKFSREKSVPARRRKRANDPKLVDLSTSWHLLLARGKQNAGSLLIHSTKAAELPISSDSKVDVSQATDVDTGSGVSSKRMMKRAHGCLMILAWVLCAGSGIIIARFYKPVWPDKTLFNKIIWFQLHRIFMVSVLILTVIGFILIFVSVGGFQLHKELPQQAHPIMGIIVTILCCLNPIMALFRPHPDHKRRYIFNWFHRSVGFLAHILSMATIIIGLKMDNLAIHEAAVWVMVAYVVFHFLVSITLDVFQLISGKNQAPNPDGIEMASEAAGTPAVNSQDNLLGLTCSQEQALNCKKLFLSLYEITVLAFVICLLVLVSQG